MRRTVLFIFLLTLAIPPMFASSDDIHVIEYIETEDGTLLGISRDRGFVVSTNGGRSWTEKNNGIPEHVAYPFDKSAPLPLTSIAVDPTDHDRVAVTSSWGLYVSENRGGSWEVLTLASPVSSSAYVTSAAVSPHNDNIYLVGTSFSGIYVTYDRGKTWYEYEDLTRPLYQGAGFLEEISSMVYHPEENNTLYLGVGFGGGLYRADLDRQVMTPVPYPGDEEGAYIEQVTAEMRSNGGYGSGQLALTVRTNKGSWTLLENTGRWTRTADLERFQPSMSMEKIDRLKKAAGRSGIYLKSWNVGSEDLPGFITFLKQHGMNSIVVDVKDDLGRITYNTSLQMPYNTGAVRQHIVMQDLLKTAHANGIYVIGRIVCFQDPILYRYNNYAYSVWNYHTGGPWGHKFKRVDEETEEVTWVQREFWVDTFSEDVWEYNVSIAKELEGLGIDEIQFDYIRFPSDGDMTGIGWRYQKEGMQKIDALESFLRMARERLSIPISTDLYGFNSWYRMGNWIGQNIEMVSHYVDAISPMYYPSHFPRDFLKDMAYFPRSYHIYQVGSDRAAYITEGRSVIRPYVQAFLIGGEVNFELPEYTTYLIQQLEGVKDGAASGFTLWNNSNRYYMVTQPLNAYTKRDTGGYSTLMD